MHQFWGHVHSRCNPVELGHLNLFATNSLGHNRQYSVESIPWVVPEDDVVTKPLHGPMGGKREKYRTQLRIDIQFMHYHWNNIHVREYVMRCESQMIPNEEKEMGHMYAKIITKCLLYGRSGPKRSICLATYPHPSLNIERLFHIHWSVNYGVSTPFPPILCWCGFKWWSSNFTLVLVLCTGYI